ncbi:sensor histidine kinase [Nocardia huaxiensis]|uniref:histidine kinase n=1 Tax=Nocardia huaxiensis TaxID=2755382 RepID=A0A7D6ZE17_9NOCA|nr:sensor histidine kinase [Nocardia huaxiensis]QLY27927.1 sensor histidine kinase [Nocardia huaxiensis]UFS98662.1 sensor histidine kinase [Nocardia huaxiensis]
MRRFSLWLRDRPLITDSMLALGLFVLDILAIGESRQKVIYAVLGVALSVPIVFRRTYPRAAALALVLISFATTVIHWAGGDHDAVHPALLGLGIMLYTLVAYVGRREGLWYLGALIADSVLSWIMIGKPEGVDAPFTAVYYALCWTLAEFVGARHAYDAEVAARLAVADYDRERRAHDAVAAERTRIARELHDVVAHAVSVIIVQADGARYALRQDPDTAEQALATIAGTGREALRELRRTVELLRTEHAPEQLPQHGTAGIAGLVAMMRNAGLNVSLELTGEIDSLSPEVSLGIHRIVQESLTNTLRHAGSDSHADVRVTRRDTDVLVEVIDCGGAPDTRTPAPAIPGSGLGLVGMRERMAVLGGTLTAGRNGKGGWAVRATIPLDRESD